ncbi:carboxymuconolactone decarboxylase family protein [Vagococcus sp. BWB3-3]|uniref:Carboxymuconolactone decarboxylase family protein n=1 Tax=Vagococcus allomyrinae TaxID=2794353 RepID=A0A940SWS6_9ENTE|nr:carboxymuconolactone decarboxylase family protein [Vagococcus allomyrinae]MBP1043590.1 carboxymuconolactone decarboxylase family protein [Vagococcus allomyrinae]
MAVSQRAQEARKQLFPNETSSLQTTDPEFVEIFDNFAFDEVLAYSQLSVKLRLKVILGALIGVQSLNEFKQMMVSALKVGVTPVEIKEIVYQAIPYLGQGKVMDFLYGSNDVLKEQGISLPLEGQATSNQATRYEKGLEIVKEVTGDVVDQMLETMPANQVHLAKFIVTGFGDYFSRNGLTIRERELLIFTFLATMGGAERQLEGHIINNIRVGNAPQELIETLTVLLPFIGYPRTLTALNCLNAVLKEEEI